MDKAVDCFRSPGLWPYDPDQLKDDEFLPLIVTDEPAACSNGSLASDKHTFAIFRLIITVFVLFQVTGNDTWTCVL